MNLPVEGHAILREDSAWDCICSCDECAPLVLSFPGAQIFNLSHDNTNEFSTGNRKILKIDMCDTNPCEENSAKYEFPIRRLIYECHECGRKYRGKKTLTNHIARTHTLEYRCAHCYKNFRGAKDQLERHIAFNTLKGAYRCPRCVLEFASNCSLNAHVLKDHKLEVGENVASSISEYRNDRNITNNTSTASLQSPLICAYCRKLFKKRKKYDEHAFSYTGDPPYECDICAKEFDSACVLKNHTQSQHRTPSYMCSVCGKTCANENSLKRHSMARHTNERNYLCDYCSKGFVEKKELLRHLYSHNDEPKPFPCDFCQKRFTDKKFLEAHTRIHTGEKPFSCGACDRSFTQKSALDRHNLTHTGVRPYECDLCSKSFCLSSELKKHRKVHNPNNRNEYVAKCDVCHKSFLHESSLRTHMYLHSDKLAFECESCGCKFKTRSVLRRHTMKHYSPKSRVVCHFCGKSFLEKYELKKHLRCHDEKQLLPCSKCSKQFKSNSQLQGHMRSHMAEYRECPICRKHFGNPRHLRRHLRKLHPSSEPYDCKYCGATFDSIPNLKAHAKIHVIEGNSQLKVARENKTKIENNGISAIASSRDTIYHSSLSRDSEFDSNLPKTILNDQSPETFELNVDASYFEKESTSDSLQIITLQDYASGLQQDRGINWQLVTTQDNVICMQLANSDVSEYQ